MGVVQALTGCGERCDLPMPAYRSCTFCVCYVVQKSSNFEQKCALNMRQEIGVGVVNGRENLDQCGVRL